MKYGSVCSGIEAATTAWHPLGWQASFVSEIEAFPRAVLQHRWPEIPLHGDFTTIGAGEYEPIDLLVGGTPCQSFSVAGLRGGLADDRGNLALEYLRLADRLRPRWLVWENVPGVLSSAGGRDFGAILGGLVELGYGFAYRVLDAQFFGVAQRRRRVFVVGHFGDWRRAAAVLFERHSMQGHPAPRREAGQRPAPSLDASFGRLQGCSGQDANHGHGHLIAFGSKEYAQDAGDVAPPLRAMGSSKDHPNGGGQVAIAYSIMPQNSGKDYKGRLVEVAQPVMAGGPVGGNQGGDYIVHAIQAGALRENPSSGPDGLGVQADHAYTLEARAEVQAIAYGIRSDASRSGEAKTPSADAQGRVRLRNPGMGVYEEIAPTVDASQAHAVAFAQKQRDEVRLMDIAGALAAAPGVKQQTFAHLGSAVRRLTPRECERLQGFPDDYTLIPWRKGMAPDGPRYKALGNSMAVPVMAWLGRRIAQVDARSALQAAA